MSSLISQFPRRLLPRLGLLHRPRYRASFRYATTSAPRTLSEQLRKRQQQQELQKTPATLSQPDKYRPPSHGKRAPRSETKQYTYGPAPSEEDKKRMATKKYPNMMSPEGTFSHWFFHNKSLHLFITLGILVSLMLAAFVMDFKAKTIYLHLLPTWAEFRRHPIQSTKKVLEVYRMHALQQTELVEAKRLKAREDVEKRKQYRLERIREAEERGEEYIEEPRYYVGEDGVRRRRVKRWFGIWE